MKYDIISERTAKYEVKVSYPSDLYPSLKRYATKKKEYFYVCSLDASNSLIKINMISVGILNRALIHPREVFRAAIKDNSASIILVHNHPSGCLEPSFEDKEVTKRLVQAGEIIGIKVLDHIIISKKGFRSFTESGEESLKVTKE